MEYEGYTKEEIKDMSISNKLNFLVDKAFEPNPLDSFVKKSTVYGQVAMGILSFIIFLGGLGEAVFWIIHVIRQVK